MHACVRLLNAHQVTRPYTADDAGKFVPIVAFDCRGCEPTAWYPDKARAARGVSTQKLPNSDALLSLIHQGFDVKTIGGATFEDIDLGEARSAARACQNTLTRASAHICALCPSRQGEWTEYDEAASDSVSVMELAHEFKVHREK
jgi:hypothetical protein